MMVALKPSRQEVPAVQKICFAIITHLELAGETHPQHNNKYKIKKKSDFFDMNLFFLMLKLQSLHGHDRGNAANGVSTYSDLIFSRLALCLSINSYVTITYDIFLSRCDPRFEIFVYSYVLSLFEEIVVLH